MHTFGEVVADLVIAKKTNIAQPQARYQSLGDYIMACAPTGGMTGNFVIEDSLIAVPVMVSNAVFISGLAFILTNSGGPNTRGRIGLYTADDITCQPKALVAQGAEFNLGLGNDVYEATFAPRQLPDGSLWWIAFNCTVPGAEAIPKIGTLDNASSIFGWFNDGGGELASAFGWAVPLAYGVLPAVFPSGGSVNGAVPYALALKVAH